MVSEEDTFIRVVKELIDELHPTAPARMKPYLEAARASIKKWEKDKDPNTLKAAWEQMREAIAANRKMG